MKKQLLFVSMAIMSLGAFAQSLPVMEKLFPIAPKKSLPAKTERSMSCDNDTLQYPYVKELIQASPNFQGFGLLTGSASMGSGYAQTFVNNSSVSISGVNFWGFVLDRATPTQSLTVSVAIYNVNATNQPTTSLGSTNITLTGLTDNFYTATFSSPITTSANYAVVLTNSSTSDTLGIVLNAAATATYGEGLSSLQYMGTWYASSALFAPDEPEAVFAPIVTYPVAADYTYSPTSICENQTINFTNTTTPTGHLSNRMYNWNVFSLLNGLATTDSTYAWDMGDASAPIWNSTTSYSYPTAGAYDVTLYTLAGFWKSCTDTKMQTLNVTVCTGINEANKDAVSVYPNPSNGLFTVNFNSSVKGMIEVYNVIGEVVYTAPVNGTTSSVDLSALTAGVYSLKVSSENANFTKSIVLTK